MMAPPITSLLTNTECSLQPSRGSNARHACARASVPASKAQLCSGTPTCQQFDLLLRPAHGYLRVARSLRNSQVTSITSNSDALSRSETTSVVSRERRSQFHSATKRQQPTHSERVSSLMGLDQVQLLHHGRSTSPCLDRDKMGRGRTPSHMTCPIWRLSLRGETP